MLASKLETLIDEQALQSQDPEDRYLTTGVNWQHYEALLVRLEDRPGFRVTYLDGVVEIVSPSLRHEDIQSRIGDLLLVYFLETDTDYLSQRLHNVSAARTAGRDGGRRELLHWHG